MTEKEKHTEEKITEAAKEVFLEKGMDGARMQEIADRAGINKSLLHYYFRTKEKLFDYIFSTIVGKIGIMLAKVMDEQYNIETKIQMFVDGYIDLLLANPFLPNFIINQMTRNPDSILSKFAIANIDPQSYFIPLQKQLDKEGYHILPQEFIVNLLSLVIFPLVARPVIEGVLFNKDSKSFKAFIKERKESIPKFILAGLEAYR
jgi:AcrR family transcriptional regulator